MSQHWVYDMLAHMCKDTYTCTHIQTCIYRCIFIFVNICPRGPRVCRPVQNWVGRSAPWLLSQFKDLAGERGQSLKASFSVLGLSVGLGCRCFRASPLYLLSKPILLSNFTHIWYFFLSLFLTPFLLFHRLMFPPSATSKMFFSFPFISPFCSSFLGLSCHSSHTGILSFVCLPLLSHPCSPSCFLPSLSHLTCFCFPFPFPLCSASLPSSLPPASSLPSLSEINFPV